MGNVVGISDKHLTAVDGADIPTFFVNGVVGMDFSGGELARAVQSYDDGNGVRLILNTAGGDASEAFHFYDYVRAEALRVFVDGYGKVMSAGTVIMAAAGRKRSRLAPNAEYMVHNASGGDAKRLADANLKMANIYAEVTGRDRKEMLAMMKAETFMSAEEARKAGFVGEVIQLQKLAAQADNNNPMSDTTTKVTRVFAVDREKALASIVTGKIELECDVDKDLKAQLDSAVTDLKAKTTECDELKAAADLKDEAVKAQAAAEKAVADLTAKHEADLKAVGVEADKLKAELDKLKLTPLAPSVKAKADDVTDPTAPISAERPFKKLNAQEREASFAKVRHSLNTAKA